MWNHHSENISCSKSKKDSKYISTWKKTKKIDEPRLLWNGTLWEMSFHKPFTASPADSETKIHQILLSSLNTTFKKQILIWWQILFCCNLPHWNKKNSFLQLPTGQKKNISQPEKQGVNYWQPPARHCTVYYVLKFGTFHRSTLQYPGSARDTPSPFEKNQRFGTVFVN